jgi:tetratricopeptide (TPR) repeat protein
MKFPSIVIITGFFAWAWVAAAAPDKSAESALQQQDKSLPELIKDLADEKFRVRENASRAIWKIGEPALAALQESAQGNDPEQAYRANELLRMIQLHVTPDTDPAVIALVERYDKASGNEKVMLFDQMHKRRAWRQLLKLYAAETSPELQSRLFRSVEGVAVVAARERLLLGDAAGAREYLEMAPADAPGLLALADFHRSQGTLDTELKRAKTLGGPQASAWQFALYRAVGNLEAARDAAAAAGELRLSAAMATLLGDPLPWLRQNEAGSEGGEVHKPYSEIAIKRWQGKEIRPVDLEPLVRMAGSRTRDERDGPMISLFLLGRPDLGEKAYLSNSKLDAFAYLVLLERIPEALKALGLDPENPDYTGWVEKRFKHLTEKGADDDQSTVKATQELILLGNFLERRGLHQQCSDAFLKPLAALAEKDAENFPGFLSQLFGGNSTLDSETLGAPLVSMHAGIAWAGDRLDRWEELVNSAVGGQDEVVDLWNWLAEIKPTADRAERFEAVLALCGIGRDPRGLREKWLALGWAAIDQAPEQKRPALLEKMEFILGESPDVVNNLKLWELLPRDIRRERFRQAHIFDLSAAGRWLDAADFFQEQITAIASAKGDPQPSLYACLAACLRQAGQVEEAVANDSIVETLALGNDAIAIANGYAYGADYKRAADWWARGARQSAAGSPEFSIALQLHADMLRQQGKWLESAAVSEVSAQMSASVEAGNVSPLGALRLRLQSDLGRALANLKKDRAKSIEILDHCHEMFPSDGSLADDFFPAIRRTGLIKEHDEWFKSSWDRMCAVIERFPDCDNTLNTTAWLASRAKRNLDQAKRFSEHALALNPEQAAYLDTMAEVEFARGNWEKALEWSSLAVNFMPLDSMLRRQHERFRNGPLPR